MKNGGLNLWNAVAFCEMSKTSWQMGKLLMKGDTGNHFEVPYFLWVQWLSVIRFLHKTSQGFTNLA